MKTASQQYFDWANSNLKNRNKIENQNAIITYFTAQYKGIDCKASIIGLNYPNQGSVNLILIKPDQSTEEFLFQNDTIENEITKINEKLDLMKQAIDLITRNQNLK